MSTYQQRLNTLVELVQTGQLPPHMKDTALLAIEDEPPKWRVFKHRAWERAVEMLMFWAIRYRRVD